MNKKVIIIGAGGHAKVIADIVIKNNDILLGFLDDNIEIGTYIIENYKVLGNIPKCIEYKNDDIEFIIGIGDNHTREKIADMYDLKYYTAIHPNAIISIDVKIYEGTTIMAGSCINAGTCIGKHCIINTGAIVEHDNVLEDYVHISPNAVLAGNIKIGKYTHIGVGAIVRNNIIITKDCIIGAGAVVVKDINETGKVYVGLPAHEMEKKI